MTTTYHAVATKSGDWWAIEITSGLPDNMLGVSQAPSLEEVEDVARSVVADLLEIERNEIALRVSVAHPGERKAALLGRDQRSPSVSAPDVTAEISSRPIEPSRNITGLVLVMSTTVEEAPGRGPASITRLRVGNSSATP